MLPPLCCVRYLVRTLYFQTDTNQLGEMSCTWYYHRPKQGEMRRWQAVLKYVEAVFLTVLSTAPSRPRWEDNIYEELRLAPRQFQTMSMMTTALLCSAAQQPYDVRGWFTTVNNIKIELNMCSPTPLFFRTHTPFSRTHYLTLCSPPPPSSVSFPVAVSPLHRHPHPRPREPRSLCSAAVVPCVR
jgi:hypothetical protein